VKTSIPVSGKFLYKEVFPLESGEYLPGFELFYTTYGELNKNRDNVIWVCHALTGNSDFTSWWPGLFGKGKIFDPEKHLIICANMLGSCYGSTGPLSIDPRTRKPYYHNFPELTNRDIVRSFDILRSHLNIDKIHTLTGGSLGGQHSLEWSIMYPERMGNLIHIASNAQHSPWGIAFNESQRMAIQQDITWELSTDKAGINGMKVARSIALLSYRHYHTYAKTQTEPDNEGVGNYRASSYQRYQGEKLAKRFNAFSYWVLSEVMDSHNVGRDRGSIQASLQLIQANCLIIGVTSDILFPLSEQEFVHKNIPGSSYAIIDSEYGHDGFLIETEALEKCIGQFYAKLKSSVPAS
jgi:homoserine O-acetyltransferase/O-succinyltransferase